MNNFYEKQLKEMLSIAELPISPCYKTDQVAKLLAVSNRTIRTLCLQWTPKERIGIESYLINTHRRIPFHGLVNWLETNSSENRI